jgi:hypothetical protein
VIQEEDAKVLLSDGALRNSMMKEWVGTLLKNVWDSPVTNLSVQDKEGSGLEEDSIVDIGMAQQPPS